MSEFWMMWIILFFCLLEIGFYARFVHDNRLYMEYDTPSFKGKYGILYEGIKLKSNS